MEGIVYGIANINFHQNLEAFIDENRTPNSIPMESPVELYPHSSDTLIDNSECNSRANTPTDSPNDNNSWEETDDIEGSEPSGSSIARRRQLPPRSAKMKFLNSTKRRTIMKPTKRVSLVHKDFHCLKQSEIKKLYTSRKLTKFTPASLETIIEESDEQCNGEEEDTNSQMRFLGTRKFRRSITFNECNFINKAVIKKRKAKIKKSIGTRPALRKISLAEFMDKLNKSLEETEVEDNPCCSMDGDYLRGT